MRVIGVVSGKGGVGKTTTVANLGAALASVFGRRVLVIDANFTTPDVGLQLGMFRFPNTLEDVLDKRVPSSQAIYDHPSGMGLISASLAAEETDARGLKRVLKELKGYETVLIDSAPGTGEAATTIIDACDEILIVTNPEFPAITDSLKTIELAKSLDIPIRGIILNRVMREGYELSVYEVESTCEAPVIAIIPEDAEVRKSISDMNPVVLNSPDSPAAIEFTRLAAHLIGREYIAPVGAMDRVIESTAGVAAKTTGVLSETEKRAVGVFSIIIGLFVGLAHGMAECIKFLIEGIAGLVNGTARFFTTLISVAVDRLRRIDVLLAWVLGGIKEDITLLGRYLVQLIRRLIECVLWVLSGIGGFIVLSTSKSTNSLRMAAALFVGLLSGIAESFVMSLNKVKDDIKSFREQLTLLLQKIIDLPTKAVELFVDLAKKIAELFAVFSVVIVASFVGLTGKTSEYLKLFARNLIQLARHLVECIVRLWDKIKTGIRGLSGDIKEGSVQLASGVKESTVGLRSKTTELVGGAEERTVEVSRSFLKKVSDSLSEIAGSFMGVMSNAKENIKLLANHIIRSIEYLIKYIAEFVKRIIDLLIKPKEVELPEIREREMVAEIPVPVERVTKVEEYPAGVFDAVKISLIGLANKIEENIKLFVEYIIQLIKRLIELFVRVTGEIKDEIKVAFIELRARASGFLSVAKERTVGLLNNIAELSTRSLAITKEYLTLFVRRLTRLIRPEEVELPREIAVETLQPLEPELFYELEEGPSIFDTITKSFTGLSYKIEEGTKSLIEYIIQLIKYLIECTGRLAERIGELSVKLTSKAKKSIDQSLYKVRENIPILTTKVIEFLNNATEALVGLTDNVEEYVQLLAGYLSQLITHLVKYIIRLVKKIASLLKRDGKIEYVKLPEVEVTETGEGIIELEIKHPRPVTMERRISSPIKKVGESSGRLIKRGREYISQVLMRERE
ncbi:MAG: P-loop NTPase [Methanosarcinales archaeon]|nr:MAG: P-loop NTPase [Methanosarcinales archaeon]